MAGENNSKDTATRLKEYEKVLDDYLQNIGVGSIQFNAEVEDVLTMTQIELRGLSPEDLGEKAYVLAQYSAYIRKEYNRNNTRLQWAEHDLRLLIAKEYGNYKSSDEYIKYDLVVTRIVNANSVARALYDIIKHARSRVNELEGLSSAINTMSKVIMELQQTKRYRR